MPDNLPRKDLIIAVIEKDNSILMRKKPEGSFPYKETWYLFGCEQIPTQDNPTTIKNYLKSTIGIDVEVDNKLIPFGTEIKEDHDGITKIFTYVNIRCVYLGGEPKIPNGAERVEWVKKDELKNYDLVPPSRKLLEDIGYIK